MKVNNGFAILSVVTLLLLITSSTAIENKFTFQRKGKVMTKEKAILIAHQPIKMESLTLKQPIRLYNTDKEKILTARIRYMYKSKVNKDPKLPQNMFDYKLFQINDEHMIIYRVDQSLTEFDERSVNSSHYLMTIKLENIDLLCNDYYFLCSEGEFRKQFGRKLRHIDMKTAKEIAEVFPESVSGTNCIIFTIGLFESLGEVGYLCFDHTEDAVFFGDLLSERILKRYEGDYEGQIRLVNQVNI